MDLVRMQDTNVGRAETNVGIRVRARQRQRPSAREQRVPIIVGAHTAAGRATAVNVGINPIVRIPAKRHLVLTRGINAEQRRIGRVL